MQIEGQTAYMLFYERNGIDIKAYLPKFREPSTSSAESANSENLGASAAGGSAPAGSPAGRVHSAAVNGVTGQLDEQEESKKCRLM